MSAQGSELARRPVIAGAGRRRVIAVCLRRGRLSRRVAVGAVLAVLCSLAVSAGPAAAQGRRVRPPADSTVADTGGAGSGTGGAARDGAEGGGVPGEGMRQRRGQLEQRFRRQLEQVVRTRLGLTDSQMDQLRAVNQRYIAERRGLGARERQLRQALRAELQPGVAADQAHVGALMDSLLAQQRARLDLVQREQHDLSAFLTPVQRVRYYALQEQIRRRVERMRQGQRPPPAP